jgi:hypothetical protein
VRTLLVTYANGVTHPVRLPPDASLDDAVRAYRAPGVSVVVRDTPEPENALATPPAPVSGHVGGGA